MRPSGHAHRPRICLKLRAREKDRASRRRCPQSASTIPPRAASRAPDKRTRELRHQLDEVGLATGAGLAVEPLEVRFHRALADAKRIGYTPHAADLRNP